MFPLEPLKIKTFPKSLIYKIWGLHGALLKIRFFSDIKGCALVYRYRGFEGISCLHLQGSFLLVYLKAWETNYSKLLVATYQFTLRLVSGNWNLLPACDGHLECKCKTLWVRRLPASVGVDSTAHRGVLRSYFTLGSFTITIVTHQGRRGDPICRPN